jgi:excisionase family DNA binding protein
MKTNNNDSRPEILTVRQLADYLHCHTSTIYRLARRGEIPGAFHLGGTLRFHLQVLAKSMRARKKN